jgi:sugar phosphate isomerase/epimerase
VAEQWLSESLADLSRTAELLGVALALENTSATGPAGTSQHMLGILDAINSPGLGVCFDTGHANVSPEGLPVMLDALKGRIVSFHLHDNDGRRDHHLQPPFGSIDWQGFADIFGRMDFQGNLTVEALPWGTADLSTMMREVTAVVEGRQMTAQLDGRDVAVRCRTCRRYVFRAAAPTGVRTDDGGSTCGCDRVYWRAGP